MLDSLTQGFIIPLYLFFSNTATPFTFGEQQKQYNEFVTVNSFAEYNSNAVNTAFLWKFAGGGYINKKLKDAVNNRLGSRNRMGLDFNTEIFYTKMGDSLFGGKDWGYFIGVKNRIYSRATFRPEVFQLGFYGNAPYAGKEMDLSNTSASLTMYQQLEVGFIKQFLTKKVKHSFGIGAGFINGNFHLDFQSNAMNLYTEPTGQYIDVGADFMVRQSDPETFSPFSPTGQGAGFDLFYELRAPKGHSFTFQVNDIGFISWNDLSRQLFVDTVTSFDGITVQNIFSFEEDLITNLGDSLSSLFKVRQDSGRFITMLPMHFHAGYSKYYEEAKVMMQVGVEYRLFADYVPKVYLRTYFYPLKWLMVGGGLAYGGFGSIQIGLDVGFNFGKGYILNINSRNLEGIVPNHYGTGVSAGLRFSKYF